MALRFFERERVSIQRRIAHIRIRDDITVADGEESDGSQPHGVQQVGVLLVVVSEGGGRKRTEKVGENIQ